ncbi:MULTISPECIES: hypothetical protein [Halobacterium]|uniref:hypothetical protein n=1 Tax=Halobacterium TaxID=2239 RepID=UPI0019640E89|nr:MULTISPECIES: hypothetical protein [Halobacterium]MDL0121307.1 hypothetical protein [Halobacterium salinarum]MDL0132578.1 hypothetical protein [Halobacterium salinarum]QRY25266.1 hypothetical protein JRZ79_02360 [Halobacterium sp. BOL4-2]
MGTSDDLTEAGVRRAVRQGVADAGLSLISTVFWTILSVFTVLVGLQAVQMAFYTTGLAAVAFAAVGILITGASVYLTYLLHWA